MRSIGMVVLSLLQVGCGGLAAEQRLDVSAMASAERGRSCSAAARAAADLVLALDAVVRVEPLQEKTWGRAGPRQGRLLGDRVYLRAVPGMTPEVLEGALRCHCAERLLGVGAARATDPFCGADGWVNIDVGFDRRGYVVELRTATDRQAEALLEQTRASMSRRTATAVLPAGPACHKGSQACPQEGGAH